MKKYLKNLEAELKKMNLNDDEIAEILADHKEMIEAAYEDGVTDEELELKFGDPENLAKVLQMDAKLRLFDEIDDEGTIQEGDLKGYVHLKTFAVEDGLKEVKIALVSEEVEYLEHEEDTVEVFAKNLKDEEKYEIEYKNNVFKLRKKSEKSFKLFGFGIKHDKVNFVVKVPKGLQLDKFDFKLVSGDANIYQVKANEASVKTTSGDVLLQHFQVQNTLQVVSVSGDLKLHKSRANKLEISTVSGDAHIEFVETEAESKINTVSGDTLLNNFQGTDISYNAVSGDLDGVNVFVDTVSLNSISGDMTINNNGEHDVKVTHKKSLSGDVTIK